jgi:hypothetical protein
LRYVDISDLRLEDDWLPLAHAAACNVLAWGAKISDYEDLWRDLKQRLSQLLEGKCWFCETPVTRSDNAVDHFRPKGRVADAEREHGGYRWLSFEPRNFRFACTFCNSRRVDVEYGTSGGKADRFPLIDEANRVYTVDPEKLDYDDLLRTVENERPKILDPCDPNDWRLLGCMRENGHPCATSDDQEIVERVNESIDVYHLIQDATCKQRHTVSGQFLELVRDAKAAFLDIDTTSPPSRRRFDQYATAIHRMIRRKAPYSGEMHFLLRGQRSAGHPWIQEVLERG